LNDFYNELLGQNQKDLLQEAQPLQLAIWEFRKKNHNTHIKEEKGKNKNQDLSNSKYLETCLCYS